MTLAIAALRLAGLERPRPAAVLLDDLVDLPHQADGLGEGDDDLLVVGDVVLREHAALAVLEPLLADLVAADVEVPHLLGHATEADGAGRGGLALLRRGGVEPDGVVRPADPPDLGVLRAGVGVMKRSSLGDSIRCRATSSPPRRASARNSSRLPVSGTRGKSILRSSRSELRYAGDCETPR